MAKEIVMFQNFSAYFSSVMLCLEAELQFSNFIEKIFTL